MAWAFVQANKQTGGSKPVLGSAGLGNLILVALCNDHGSGQSAPTDGTNTYFQAGATGVDTLDNQEASLWWAVNNLAASLTITIANAAACSSVALEFSGLASSSVVDTTSTPKVAVMTHTGTNDMQTTASTAAAANELAVVCFNDGSGNNTMTVGAGWTTDTNAVNGGGTGTGATLVQWANSTGASQASLAGNGTANADNYIGLQAFFKLPAAGAAPGKVMQPNVPFMSNVRI